MGLIAGARSLRARFGKVELLEVMNTSNGLKLAGVAGLLLLASACATNKPVGPDVVANTGDNTAADTRPTIVKGSQEDLAAAAGDRVFFGYDQHSLTAQAQETLARQAAWLNENAGTRLLVAGNCDERGTREYNLALGARRAEAARSYLISLGVDGSRLSTVSYGKERPLDARSTDEAWSVNRNAASTVVAAGV